MKSYIASLPIGIISLIIAVGIFKMGSFPIGYGMTTYYCATLFLFWALIIFIQRKKDLSPWLFTYGAVLFATLGTYTVTTYNPFGFNLPTAVHLFQVLIGYGFLIERKLR